MLDAWPFLRTVRTRNTAPRKLGNSCSNPVGDLIVVELSRYQAEERIAIQEIHQQLDVRFLGNFSAILCRLKRDRGESLLIFHGQCLVRRCPRKLNGPKQGGEQRNCFDRS